MNHLNQFNFHVFSSDKEVLGKITNIMEKKGIVSIWQKSGEMLYLVDGRYNLYRAIDHMNHIAEQVDNIYGVASKNTRLRNQVLKLLSHYEFKSHLKGYYYLSYILQMVYSDERLLNSIGKVLFEKTASLFNTSNKLVDRSIRYAVKLSSIEGSNRTIIQRLVLELQAMELQEEKNKVIDN